MTTFVPEKARESAALLISECQEGYNQGQFETVLAILSDELPEQVTLAAWCHYRAKRFPECARMLDIAEALASDGATQRTLACRAYLYAYAPDFKDETALMALMPRLSPTNIDGLNAVAISARAEGSLIDPVELWGKAEAFAESLDISAVTVSGANFLHNLARLAEVKEEFNRALHYIDLAIAAYGPEAHWHHRAAAQFWRSKIYQGMGDLVNAKDAAQESLALWTTQRDLEPDNAEWGKRVAGAVAREQELALLRL